MKGSKAQLKMISENQWVYKRFKNQCEMENLLFLKQLNLKIIPNITNITTKGYSSERCEPLDLKDLLDAKFDLFYYKVIGNLHKYKSDSYTPGIYKFFTPVSLKISKRNNQYVSQIISQLNIIINRVNDYYGSVIMDGPFIGIINLINIIKQECFHWKPLDGYSLLHGDLHVSNIVKKKGSYFLIDYEYLRYGAIEIEIANLLVSMVVSIYQSYKNCDFIICLKNRYKKDASRIANINTKLFDLLWYISLILFYIFFYIKQSKEQLFLISRIMEDESICFDLSFNQTFR